MFLSSIYLDILTVKKDILVILLYIKKENYPKFDHFAKKLEKKKKKGETDMGRSVGGSFHNFGSVIYYNFF